MVSIPLDIPETDNCWLCDWISAHWTLFLLVQPVQNARPTEQMAADCGACVFPSLQAQYALDISRRVRSSFRFILRSYPFPEVVQFLIAVRYVQRSLHRLFYERSKHQRQLQRTQNAQHFVAVHGMFDIQPIPYEHVIDASYSARYLVLAAVQIEPCSMHRLHIWNGGHNECAALQGIVTGGGQQTGVSFDFALHISNQLDEESFAGKLHYDREQLQQFARQRDVFVVDLNDARVLLAERLQIVPAGEAMVGQFAQQCAQVIVLYPQFGVCEAKCVRQILPDLIGERLVFLHRSKNFRLSSVGVVETHIFVFNSFSIALCFVIQFD